jgi:hypothetical protein
MKPPKAILALCDSLDDQLDSALQDFEWAKALSIADGTFSVDAYGVNAEVTYTETYKNGGGTYWEGRIRGSYKGEPFECVYEYDEGLALGELSDAVFAAVDESKDAPWA